MGKWQSTSSSRNSPPIVLPQLSWLYSKDRIVEPTLSRINPICIVKYYILKSLIFYYHLCLDLPSDLFPRVFWLRFYVYFSSLQFILHFQPISSLLFDHPNNTNYAASPPSCYLLLDPKIHVQICDLKSNTFKLFSDIALLLRTSLFNHNVAANYVLQCC